MNDEQSRMASGAVCFAADQIKLAFEEVARELQRPSLLFRPALTKDGNMWCALFGDNLQEGIVGFGESPSKAMYAFDTAWFDPNGSHIIYPKQVEDSSHNPG